MNTDKKDLFCTVMSRVFSLALCLCCASAQGPRSPQDLMNEALAAQRAGNLDEAIRGYRLLLERYPDLAEIRSNLGAALAGKGRYQEAITEYKRALLSKPDPKVGLNLGIAYYKTDRLALAVETLKKVREQDPANTQILTILADCYLRLGQNKDVIDLLTPVQRADPDNRTFNYLLGAALVRDGQASQGQLVIDKILKDGDSAEARLLMGTTKFMVSDFSGALTDFQKAVELNPNMPDVHAYLGMALVTTGDREGAKKAFARALAADPNNFDANLRLGVLLRQDQENNRALQLFHHALEVRPGDFGVRYQIASVGLAKGEGESARRDLEALVKEAPEFKEAHVSLARIYFRQKKKIEGEREQAIVLKLNAQRQAAEQAGIR